MNSFGGLILFAIMLWAWPVAVLVLTICTLAAILKLLRASS